MSQAQYRMSVRGARKVGFSLSRAGRGIQIVLLDEFAGNLAPTLTRIARDFAPHDSGRLERGIKAEVRSAGGRITLNLLSTAVSDTGFPYTQVTRKGHREIRPQRAKVLAWRGRGGGFTFATFVRAWKPDGDWVQKAEGSWEQEIDRSADRIGRQVVTRLL
jgi:hypothetical protein